MGGETGDMCQLSSMCNQGTLFLSFYGDDSPTLFTAHDGRFVRQRRESCSGLIASVAYTARKLGGSGGQRAGR